MHLATAVWCSFAPTGWLHLVPVEAAQQLDQVHGFAPHLDCDQGSLAHHGVGYLVVRFRLLL